MNCGNHDHKTGTCIQVLSGVAFQRNWQLWTTWHVCKLITNFVNKTCTNPLKWSFLHLLHGFRVQVLTDIGSPFIICVCVDSNNPTCWCYELIAHIIHSFIHPFMTIKNPDWNWYRNMMVIGAVRVYQGRKKMQLRKLYSWSRIKGCRRRSTPWFINSNKLWC